MSIPNDPKLLPAYLAQERARQMRDAGRAVQSLQLEVLYAAPSKVRAGMVIYADGVTYNPGSGEGLYRRSVDNSAWVHLG